MCLHLLRLTCKAAGCPFGKLVRYQEAWSKPTWSHATAGSSTSTRARQRRFALPLPTISPAHPYACPAPPLNPTLPRLQPLSVELAPGIMSNIFDGIQRPLKQIAIDSASCFIPRGVDVPALDRSRQWEFDPTGFKVGDRITGGDIYGVVHENSLMDHKIMLPPAARGNITYIAPAGGYSITDKVIEVEFGGVKKVRAARV